MASHFFAQMLIICVFCLSTYCAAARPTFFFAGAASCTRVFFACLSTLGREETEKESLVTFFSVSLLSSWASKHLFVKPSVAQFWLFVRLHVLPPPHSQSNCAFVEASQGSRELDYSVIQLYFHWSCDVLWIEGALDIGKTGAVLTAPFAFSGDFLNCIIA